jgi:hypothetical protein
MKSCNATIINLHIKKICIKCGIEKLLTEFRPNKRCVDKHGNVCYVCHNKLPRIKKGRKVYAVSLKGRHTKAKSTAHSRGFVAVDSKLTQS